MQNAAAAITTIAACVSMMFRPGLLTTGPGFGGSRAGFLGGVEVRHGDLKPSNPHDYGIDRASLGLEATRAGLSTPRPARVR